MPLICGGGNSLSPSAQARSVHLYVTYSDSYRNALSAFIQCRTQSSFVKFVEVRPRRWRVSVSECRECVSVCVCECVSA